jgi:hypothetical protein
LKSALSLLIASALKQLRVLLCGSPQKILDAIPSYSWSFKIEKMPWLSFQKQEKNHISNDETDILVTQM